MAGSLGHCARCWSPAYVAVMSLVRLMARRRDQDVADVERQLKSHRKRRTSPKNRDARDESRAESRRRSALTLALDSRLPMPKLYIETVGCQMNMLDSELVVASLRKDGYELTATPAEADTILFNTCSVRQHAEDKIYSALGRLKHAKQRASRTRSSACSAAWPRRTRS